MIRILLLLLTVLIIDFTAINAQSITGTFRNSVNTTPVNDGTLSLFNISAQQWVFQGETSGHQAMIFSDTDYRIHTDQYRLTINNMFYKHHYWDQQVQEYKLHSDFNVSQGVNEITKTADFTEARKTTLFNNFEEFTDEGFVRFRDPWYVDANNEQNGDFETFASPHVPTGAYGEQDAAVFLTKEVWPNQPYYSLNFQSFLQGDYTTPTSAPLTSDDWVFIGAFARTTGSVQLTLQDQDSFWTDNGGLWQRESEYAVDIEFRQTDSELFGFYKRHRHSSSENEPTAINSQRKVVMERLAYPNRRFHQIYESDGRIYHTWSEDDGASWEGEVMLSVFGNHCVQPVIDVSKYEAGKPCLLSAAWIDESEN